MRVIEYRGKAYRCDKCGRCLRREALEAPQAKGARNIAKGFSRNGDGYLRFIEHPELEPTNNPAEQAIRFVVLDRAVTQGTRSEAGGNWSQRAWTVSATCILKLRPNPAEISSPVGQNP